MTYEEACYTATLTTTSDIEQHEARLYQPGYTPTAIRTNIQNMLRDSKPEKHMVDFQAKDIPPRNRDPRTYHILTDLMSKRNQLDKDFHLPLNAVAADGTHLHTGPAYEQEYLKRDQEYNRLNTTFTPTLRISSMIAILYPFAAHRCGTYPSLRSSNWLR